MPFAEIIGHDRAKMLLKSAIAQNRLAHAYLFHGDDRIGKRLLALRVAQALLCESLPIDHEPDACGTCRACRQVEARTHPDFLVIEPDREQANPQIKIELIRDIEQQMIYRPLIGDRKICLIDDADRMTIGAANALLKTLEEPPDHSLFLLVSSRPYALPATIRSRCQALRLAAPAQTQVEAAVILKRELPPADARFLATLSDGQLGLALECDLEQARNNQKEFFLLFSSKGLQSFSTVLATAEALAKADRAPEAFDWLLRWLRDLLLLAVGAGSDHVLNVEQRKDMQVLAEHIDIDELLDLIGSLETLERQAHRNVNLQMALETTLLRLRHLIIPQQTVGPGR
ncbi:MAG: DNA polymerase III delta prime subunit [Nitrospira sp.]|jgi:DNA polymerase-3 subunit delta'|nr:MAG: DNA polymerase III delta prime subunit [Nitrospira sp.]